MHLSARHADAVRLGFLIAGLDEPILGQDGPHHPHIEMRAEDLMARELEVVVFEFAFLGAGLRKILLLYHGGEHLMVVAIGGAEKTEVALLRGAMVASHSRER